MIKWRRKGYDFQNRIFLRQNSLAQTQGSDYADAFIAKTYGKFQTFQPFQEFVFASTMKKERQQTLLWACLRHPAE